MSSIITYAPRFSLTEAKNFAQDIFGVCGAFRQLPSERDQNFHIRTQDRSEYVLKIANKSEKKEALDFQNRAMIHVGRHKDLFSEDMRVCPEICTTRKGKRIAAVTTSEGFRHYVRMLSYLPGKPIATVKPHDAGLLKSLGLFFGNLDAALDRFDHPAAHRDFHWDLKNAAQVIQNLAGAIHDKENQAMVVGFLKHYQSHTQPKLDNLRRSVIHNDGNDYNVLVAPFNPWQNRVDSLIDYGDMVYTHTINELAIACAYIMMGKSDPLYAAKLVVAGYHQAYPLEDIELSVLFDLIVMRLCMSVCHSAHQSRMAPDNAYLRISEKPAWKLLKQLDKIHPRFAEYTFRDACDLAPVPRLDKLVLWLGQNRARFKALVEPVPGKASAVVLDLSVESPLVDALAIHGDTAGVTQAIFGEMRRKGATIGVGRYDEARAIYISDAYRQQRDQMPEMRTIHMGMDLHMDPGTGIQAFYDGKVHSFNNNAAAYDYGPTIILSHATDTGLTFYTLYGHLSLASLEDIAVGQNVARGEKFAEIGDTPVNGGWPPHLHFQIITDMLGEAGNYQGVAPPSQRQVWKALSPDPNLILGIPDSLFPAQGRNREEILSFRKKHLGKNYSISYHDPLKIVRGRGQYLIDQNGQTYLDGVNNVTHVGHCHPEVVAAGQRQMGILNTNTRYLHDHIVTYSQKLLSKFPEPLCVCFFVCTGSEANELAFRLARNYTGQKDIITVAGAYHGNTNLLVDISPYKHDGPGGRGAPSWVQTVKMPDGYRGPFKGQGGITGSAYAADVKLAIDRVTSGGNGIAAFICESVLGCGGQVVLPDNYLKEAFQYVRGAGGVCIADEVQVGFGRVGSHFWAFETQEVVPDIVTLGKPIANGHPMAVVVTTPKIAADFHNGMEYFNTFGGNPVSCAIGMAVLDVIEKERLQENALTVGHRLLEGFQKLKRRFPLIGDVRGQGLFVGVELVKNRKTLEPAPEEATYIINRLREHGILISTDGPLHNVLKLKPPMVFSKQNADDVVTVLEKILAEDCLQVP
ncbi:MAG: aminotransferase class III-fold pyridoxal phosphate-dependent enzyme [Deltaproteobacteria bacterium]|jgi:4-aminobutyrate aminotransferase-like enzyme/Ser/Thr protein kinase RdoA (MazF antagonist)|nr:aminotransferase class III-fold pyridoxal phosphate-dependent enzyme [Deltaproteobacteria bacterium]